MLRNNYINQGGKIKEKIPIVEPSHHGATIEFDKNTAEITGIRLSWEEFLKMPQSLQIMELEDLIKAIKEDSSERHKLFKNTERAMRRGKIKWAGLEHRVR